MIDLKEICIDYGMKFLGDPYIWGGNDCSGYIQKILRVVAKDPRGDQTAHAMFEWYRGYGEVKTIPERGALLFFGNTTGKMTHVAIALDSETMLEAGGGNQTTTTVKEAEKISACVRVCKINRRKDLQKIIQIF